MSNLEFKNGSKITTVDSGENVRSKVRMLSYDLPTVDNLTYVLPEVTKEFKISFEAGMFDFVSNEVKLTLNKDGTYEIKAILDIYEDEVSNKVVKQYTVVITKDKLTDDQIEALTNYKSFTFPPLSNGEFEIGYKNKREEV
ncbi:hypothetical protein [Clostridium estertheticum]|uniref:hypothetical protein n=1 Tax=Clostridium estertheticum TaxID=238834 RepID=UPI001C0E8271|nr:hypothetical protein [Clostridium estertheticum]MBU3186532.1 hypothetical protein [Clostridium estertheticum]